MSAGIATCRHNGNVPCHGFELVPVKYVQTLLARVDEVEFAGASVNANIRAAISMGTASEVENGDHCRQHRDIE
ncbi:hypothetical protein D3C85_1174580 [compost metagenome]